jgi:SRSO17 transposase
MVRDVGSKAGVGWEREFDRWLTPFLEALGDRRRRRWAPVYLRGLLGPAERKSIQPLAARVAPDDYQQLHHFVACSHWDPAPLERVLAAEAERLVGGPDAVLIIDDTALLKHGAHSVGVARQYAGCVGRVANCQVLVSLTLARGEVPVCVALRLFLPEEWTADPARCEAAGAPCERAGTHRTKAELALAELDRLTAAGVTFGHVAADAGYGNIVAFRHELSARGLTWAVGIAPRTQVYPAGVTLAPAAKPRRGPTSPLPVPDSPHVAAAAMLAAARWRTVRWRAGTKGVLEGRFAVAGVRVADGPADGDDDHRPGTAAWLVGEERRDGERRYYLTNHPAETARRAVIRAIKARWACEQAHQQMKEELGLDHCEARSWDGLHHHALLTTICLAFLQHLRLAPAPPAPHGGRGKKIRARPRPAARALGAAPPSGTPALPN